MRLKFPFQLRDSQSPNFIGQLHCLLHHSILRLKYPWSATIAIRNFITGGVEMLDFSKFKLVDLSESEQLYNCQSDLLQQITAQNFVEVTLQVAILLTLPPVADNSESIKLLKAAFEETNDIRFAIIGSFLTSEWENHKENGFIDILNSFLCKADSEQKAIIYYLKAYDILMHDKIIAKREEYIALLTQSISSAKRFVYNYYRLAQVVGKKDAKKLIIKALSNVEKVFSDEDCDVLEVTDFISFDSFLKEHIFGIDLSQQNLHEIENFCSTC
jgi:hypothetical protein